MNDHDFLEIIRNIAVKTLGISESVLDDSTKLIEFGIDSLMLLRFGQEIERQFGVRLEIAWFFKNMPNLQMLAGHVAELSHGHIVQDNSGVLPVQEGSDTKKYVSATPETSIPHTELYDTTDEITSLFRIQTEALESLFDKQLDTIVSRSDHTLSRRYTRSHKTTHNQHDFRGIKTEDEEGLTPNQEAFIDSVIACHIKRTGKSREITQKHRRNLADWKNSLSFRARLKEAVYPIVANGSNGAHFTDVDGNDYIDIALGMGVNFMGHRHPVVIEAVEKRLAAGFELGPQCNMAGTAAEMVSQLTGMERVCFSNTGSEAVMVGMRIARAKTGRQKIVIFNGAYHGIFDGVLGVRTGDYVEPLSPGTPFGMVEDIIMLEYDSSETLNTIASMAHEIAAVLVEPVQSRRPGLQPQTFLRRLRKLTKENGIALIFDEMVNGFRIAPGGAQEYFGVRADIALYGKTIGGGLPVGVIAGSAEYLDFIDGGYWQYGDDSKPCEDVVVFGGTFCRHPFAMEAVTAVARLMLDEGRSLQDKVSSLAEKMADELNLWFQDEYVPLRITRFGSQFRFESFGPWMLLANPIELDLFFMMLIDDGVYTWERRTCCLSIAHSEDDIRHVIHSVKKAVSRLREGGFLFRLEHGAPDFFRPVSSVQKRIFAAMQHENGQAPYHMPAAWIVRGDLDMERFEICFGEVIRRHECLRSGFRITGGRLLRIIDDEPRFFLEHIDADGQGPREIIRDFIRPFDLERPPLLRVGVAELDNERRLIIFDSLHIAVDGISLATLTRELDALYRDSEPPDSGASYTQYEQYMREYEQSKACSEHCVYWEQALQDPPLPLTFSPKPASQMRTSAAGHVRTLICPDLREQIGKTAASCGVTPYMLMLATYALWVRSLTGVRELVIGVATTGRPEARFDATIGMFVNTLPLRLAPDGKLTFKEFLDQVRTVTADSYQHQDVPFELIAEKTGVDISTMFTYEIADERHLNFAGLETEEIEAPIPGAMFDLSLDAIEKNKTIHLDFEFDSELLQKEYVRIWAECFSSLIEKICRNPEVSVGSIPLLPDRLKDDLISRWNKTHHEHKGSHTVLELFDMVVSTKKHKTAVIDSDGGMTYGELDEMSRSAAKVLTSKYGIGTECLVAICGAPSAKVVAAILGILRAGGAFLPLEHNSPAARTAQILENADIRLLVGSGELFEELKAGQKCSIESLISAHENFMLTGESYPSPDSLAYVIYTSGSTGNPKGCEIEHSSLHNYIVWAIEHYFPKGNAGNFCLTSPLAFDMSLMTLFVPLCMGKTLRIPDPEVNPAEALALAASPDTETDVFNLTPSHVRILSELGVNTTNVGITVVGGETLRKENIDTLLSLNPDMEIHNEYGPTEATIGCTSGRVIQDESPTIGLPVFNTTAYIVGPDLQLLPQGAWGELCIGGAGLARGYSKLPDRTKESFVELPATGERIYRTGDLARRKTDGRIELGGRLDDQLKIGGHRIEPGEIEHALMGCDGVREAAVVFNNTLFAFVAGDGNIEDIKQHIARSLPAYMLPQKIVICDSLSVSSSGKIDRKALEKLALEKAKTEPASDDTTTAIPALRIMRELSGNPNMGPSDNFFTAGGNSLDAVAVVARCGKELGLSISLREFFAQPIAETIQGKSGMLSDYHALHHSTEQENIPQTSGQKQIWLASQKSGSAYNMTEMFLLTGKFDTGLLEKSFLELIRRHEILRTRFHERNGNFYQEIQPYSPDCFAYEYIDISDRENPEQYARDLADKESGFRFDLSKGPLLHTKLFRLETTRHLCLLNIHHIITDGWSTMLMLDEVSRIYKAGGSLPDMPEWQFRDFSVWHNEYLKGKDGNRDLEYWQKTLVPPVPQLTLPGRLDDMRTKQQPAGIVEIKVDMFLKQSLTVLVQKNGTTLFVALLAGLSAVLHQRSAAEDMIIGTPAAGRMLSEFETIPGYFLNTLPIRIKITGDMSFNELLSEAARSATDALAHQLYPFDELVEKFTESHEEGRNPLFDVMLILQNTGDYGFDLPDVSAERFYSPYSREAKFDIMIELENTNGGLKGIIEYNTNIFHKEYIKSLACDLVKTLEFITLSHEANVSSLFALFSRENDTKRQQFIQTISDVSEEF